MMVGRTQIYGLDVARFVAAMLVVTYHLGFKGFTVVPEAQRLMSLPEELPPWWHLSAFGWIGVQIFFVISGLVIAYSARDTTRARFAMGRITRLLPAMLITATIVAIIEIAFYRSPVGHVAWLWSKSILFIPIGPWLMGQIWTLPIEIGFYAIICLAIVGRSPGNLHKLAWLLGAASAAYWFVRFGFRLADPSPRLTQLLPIQHGCYFALGLFLSDEDQRYRGRTRLILPLVCIATAVLQIRSAAMAEQLGPVAERLWFVAWLIFLAATAAIAISIAAKARLEALLSGRAKGLLRMLGLATYPLYLVHMQVGGMTIILARATGASIALAVTLGILACLAAAGLIAYFIEPPLNRVIKRRLEWGLHMIRLASQAHPVGKREGKSDSAVSLPPPPPEHA